MIESTIRVVVLNQPHHASKPACNRPTLSPLRGHAPRGNIRLFAFFHTDGPIPQHRTPCPEDKGTSAETARPSWILASAGKIKRVCQIAAPAGGTLLPATSLLFPNRF